MDDGTKQMGRAFLVTFGILVIQLAGFYYSDSLALLGDSAHVFSDLLAIGASLLAMFLAMRAATSRRTFGFHRFEVFAALFNGMLLVAMSLLIAYEAILRFYGTGVAVSGLPMLVTSSIGLAGNLYVAYHLQHEENLNVRSAFMHAAGDALSSVGVIIGAVIILATGLFIVDVIVSLLISAVILFSAYTILRGSLSILLESAPYGVDVERVESAVLGIEGVKGTHDIHIWRTCSDLVFAMLHVECENIPLNETRVLHMRIEEELHHRFGINHTTIQFEPHGCSCENQKKCNMQEHRKRHTHKH